MIWTGLALLAISAGLGPASIGQEQARIVVAFRVNGQSKGDVFITRIDGQLWIPLASLSDAGLTGVTGVRRDMNGEAQVSLESLAPGITFELDEAALELRLTAAAELFAPTRRVLQNERPEGIEYGRAAGVFLNYDLSSQYSTGAAQRFSETATFEAGVSVKGALASTSYSMDSDGRFIRGISALTVDAPQSMVRTVFGDTFGRASLLGSLPTVAGISIEREFGLDPYRVPYPLPNVTGSLATGGEADIYVNGVIVRRERLPPGVFNLQRLPVSGGLGDVQVVVRDAFGREQTFGGPYYFTSTVLSEGMHDFHYMIGAERTDETSSNPTYGPLVATAEHRVGITDSFTLGGRVEARRDLVSGGPLINARLARLGDVQFEAATSDAAGYVDYAVAATYQFVSHWFSASVTTQRLGPHFSTLDLAPTDARHPVQTNATIGLTGGPVTLNLFYIQSSIADVSSAAAAEPLTVTGESPRTASGPAASTLTADRRYGATVYLQLGTRVQLVMTGARVFNDSAPLGWTARTGFSVLLGPRSVAATGVSQLGDGTVQASVSAQKSLPLGSGIAYRVEADDTNDGEWSGLAQFQAQGRRGLLTLRDDSSNGENAATAEIAGSLVLAGGRVTLARTVNDGYAVIRVPANTGVRVYVNNQIAGRTGSGGVLVVPGLLPYYANSVSIAPEDVGIEYQLDRIRALIAPPNRGPALVRFDAAISHAASGRIVVIDGENRIVPAYGDVSFELGGKPPVTSPIGKAGEFYLENVPEGPLALRVAFGERTCRTTVTIPTGIHIVADLGEISCVMEKMP